MPKILSRYMDKSLRKNARPETCYTWFLCDESFLNDKDKQKRVFKPHTALPVKSEMTREPLRIILICINRPHRICAAGLIILSSFKNRIIQRLLSLLQPEPQGLSC